MSKNSTPQSLEAMFEQCKALGISPIASIVGSARRLFELSNDDQEYLQYLLVKENMTHHYEKNEFFQKLCESHSITPDQINGPKDLNQIPLIPLDIFKKTEGNQILTMSIDDIEDEMKSTGTSGIPSVSRRDFETISVGGQGILSLYREFFEMSSGAILYLMPSTEEMPDMGMVRALEMFSCMSHATRHLVKRLSFDPAKAVSVLQKWQDNHARHIIGPPFMVYHLIKYLKDHNIKLKLDKKTWVINLGGWKRFTGSQISRKQFNEECATYLGINEDQVRDMYGFTEANMLAIDCEYHHKHMPPWVYCSVRKLDDISQECELGDRGLLAVLDPTSMAYPAFVLTNDVVYLEKDTTCKCGRNGKKIVYIARREGAEEGCCAINLDKQLQLVESCTTVS